MSDMKGEIEKHDYYKEWKEVKNLGLIDLEAFMIYIYEDGVQAGRKAAMEEMKKSDSFPCKLCGKMYIPTTQHRKYCSWDCSEKAHK